MLFVCGEGVCVCMSVWLAECVCHTVCVNRELGTVVGREQLRQVRSIWGECETVAEEGG